MFRGLTDSQIQPPHSEAYHIQMQRIEAQRIKGGFWDINTNQFRSLPPQNNIGFSIQSKSTPSGYVDVLATTKTWFGCEYHTMLAQIPRDEIKIEQLRNGIVDNMNLVDNNTASYERWVKILGLISCIAGVTGVLGDVVVPQFFSNALKAICGAATTLCTYGASSGMKQMEKNNDLRAALFKSLKELPQSEDVKNSRSVGFSINGVSY